MELEFPRVRAEVLRIGDNMMARWLPRRRSKSRSRSRIAGRDPEQDAKSPPGSEVWPRFYLILVFCRTAPSHIRTLPAPPRPPLDPHTKENLEQKEEERKVGTNLHRSATTRNQYRPPSCVTSLSRRSLFPAALFFAFRSRLTMYRVFRCLYSRSCSCAY